MKVTKAVIPAAGLGTRFLPITKAVPKEMLPVVDKPCIQYNVEELVASGITDILVITSRGKVAIEDYFDYSPELQYILRTSGKDRLEMIVEEIGGMANVHFVRQKNPKGLGHAVLCAKELVGNEPFALLLGDDLVYNKDYPPIKQLIDCYEQTGKTVIATMKVAKEDIGKYGNIGYNKKDGRIYYTDKIVEKPKYEERLSDYGIIGRYVLSEKIFPLLETLGTDIRGEISLTDALNVIAADEGIISYEFDGLRYDTGDKLGYIEANIEYGLRHPETALGLKEYLKNLKI